MGFVVDDAIVMLENIVRHIEMGEGVMQAALSGSKEIGFTIVSMTLSLAAVFIPVLFMGGIMGRLLHEFAIVIMASILVSGFVSLTLTPMLCSRFLRSQHGAKHGRVYMSLERFFDRLLEMYDVSLQWSLRQRVFVMAVSGIILLITAWQFVVIPKGFLPAEDNGQIFVSTEAAQGISFASMKQHQEELNKIVMADPNRNDFFSSIGSFTASNGGMIFIHLKERNQRPKIPSQTMLALEEKYRETPVLGGAIHAIAPLFAHHPTIDEVIDELRPKFAAVAGINAYMQNLPPIQVGGELTKSQYQLTLQSPDTAELYRDEAAFEAKVAKIPGLRDVTSDLLIHNPQVTVNIDRDKASALGVSAEQVEDALYTAYGQRQISTIYAPNDEYWVVMELEDRYQADPAALSTPLRSLEHRAHWFRSTPWRNSSTDPWPAHCEPPWTVTRRYDFVQSEAGRGDRRCRQRHREVGARSSATHRHGTISGNGAGIRGVADGLGNFASHGDSGDLHRARDFVRELHSSDHDSFGIAFGCVRCAAHLADLSSQP